jgi:hypothetical protein
LGGVWEGWTGARDLDREPDWSLSRIQPGEPSGNRAQHFPEFSGPNLSVEGEQPKPDPLAERKRLTFEQVEGAEPLPQQLRLKELSPGFRAAIWNIVHSRITDAVIRDSWGGPRHVGKPWESILRFRHVFSLHRPVDEFSTRHDAVCAELKPLIMAGDYVQVLGFLQLVIRHRDCPRNFADAVNACLDFGHVAYRVVDQTIFPIGSEAEIETIKRSFVDLAKTEFGGARSHLRNAAEELTAGHYADSVRESIHAVESVAKVLEPSAKLLSTALATLEKSAYIHPAMKSGFDKLYGYTNDEQGIRHAIIEPGQPAVDETDALFMIGACAAFVSYMINKARKP